MRFPYCFTFILSLRICFWHSFLTLANSFSHWLSKRKPHNYQHILIYSLSGQFNEFPYQHNSFGDAGLWNDFRDNPELNFVEAPDEYVQIGRNLCFACNEMTKIQMNTCKLILWYGYSWCCAKPYPNIPSIESSFILAFLYLILWISLSLSHLLPTKHHSTFVR